MTDLPPAAERRQAAPSALLEPDLAKDLFRMLAEPRRPALEREWIAAHQDRTANAGRSLRLNTHPSRAKLGIGEQVGDGVDRPGGHDRFFERSEEVVA